MSTSTTKYLDIFPPNSLWYSHRSRKHFVIYRIDNNKDIIYSNCGSMVHKVAYIQDFMHYYDNNVIELICSKNTRMAELLYV